MAAARGCGDEQHLSCEICTIAYTSTGRRTPQVLRCGHSYCADCVRDLQRRAANNTISCPNRCGVTTPADVDVPKNYPLAAAIEAKEAQERHRMATLYKCATAAYSLSLAEAPIESSTLNRMQGIFINKWVGGHTTSLRSLYRSSRDGPSYGDLLRCVGDTSGLVFVIRKDTYVFGAFIRAALELPHYPRGMNEYECDVWYFSLAGHFDTPTKMEGSRMVGVAGREGTVYGVAKLGIGRRFDRWLWLGYEGGAADDMRRCRHGVPSDDVPGVYVGVRDEYDRALFGCSIDFMADEVEVLTAV
ncbi:unnamed protein product [Vitrella brassicaformis CCMP3155]|uniref:RING-type domain-containing protein n=1 Tax=Vitrella brassicaformis (strain CCMP3155) TaxID=1169540 RepID=A0A0G4END5_VITBC|nr:unnamed protein product [Vitrella brassicaformis CCMP3155]|eukprot:CEL98341.1 unnamed protein product [Vitrella brassicaformis CCMP3155]